MRTLCCICGEGKAVFGDLCVACDASYWEAVHAQDDVIRSNIKTTFPAASEDEIEDLVDAANIGIVSKVYL